MNKQEIIFSIVLCTYNRENHIKRCLDSLVNLDFPKNKFEIIVVDDGSTDSTVEIVSKYPVRLIKHKINQGIAAARNTGLKSAKGKIYICFDDDCYVSKDWLKNLANAYSQNNIKSLAGIAGFIELPGKDGVIEKYMYESGYGNPSPAYYGKSKNPIKRFYFYLKNMFSPNTQTNQDIFEVSEIWGANCSFPVDVLKAIHGWDENLSGVEDTDLCDRIKKKFNSKKFLCTKNAILYHDHKLSIKNLLLKPYDRGPAILEFYLNNSNIPPIFPFPLAILLLSIPFAILHPLYAIASIIIEPQIFYSWWFLKAIRKRKLYYLIFPYLQGGYELFSVLGLLKGFIIKNRTLTSRKLLFLLLIFGILINVLIFKNIQYYFLREILSTVYLLTLPGLLVSWAIKITYKNIWELVSYTVGLSLAILMLLGLGINYLLPYVYIHSMQLQSIHFQSIHVPPTIIPIIHITKPLSTLPILVSISTLLALLWSYVFIRNNPIPFTGINFRFSVKNILIGLIPTVLPALSVIGAFNLNNNQTNIFTMIMLGLIALFVMLLAILRDKVSQHIFPYALLMISLSLLLMTSLRGWYITGHDIYLEYFIFQLTKAQGIWKMVSFQDPYNACLSITILPTMISSVTHISDIYIYKALYQIIFSTSIVTTYLFIRKLLNPFLAFLAAFSIASLPTFMTDMPMLNRQEIALLFFALLLTTLFNKNFSTVGKWLLFILLGFGLLLSHYSTTYIAVGLFVGAFLMHLPIRIIKIHPGVKTLIQRIDAALGLVDNKPNLRFGMVAILAIATIVWNVNITNTASGIITTINKVTNDLKKSHFAKAKSDPAAYGLLSNKAPTNQSLLSTYIDTTTQFVRKFNDNTAFLDKTIYSQYEVSVGSQTKQPLTKIGQYIAHFHVDVFSLNNQLKQIYAKIIQIFIVIGFIAIFFFKKHISNFEKEYLILTITFFGILVFQTILPGGSIDYGILRLFQQGMILFSVPLIMGGLAVLSIFDLLHKGIKIYILSFIFIFFFLFLSGFLSELTGGYYPQLNLSNGGFYYDAYYTHTQDITAMGWLSKNRNINMPVQSDWFALKKIHTYEKFYSIDGLIPSVIRRNSYVYFSVSNLKMGQIIIYANGAPLYYKYDFALLDKNKNLIYNNGGSKIYR